MAWTRRRSKQAASEERAASPPAELPPVDPVDPASVSRDEVVELLRRDLVEISGGELALDEIDPKGHLFDFGYVDSLSAVVFLVRIEQRFGIQIEDVEVVETLTTVDAIAGRIHGSA